MDFYMCRKNINHSLRSNGKARGFNRVDISNLVPLATVSTVFLPFTA
jgi:hypothetical protein